MSRFNDLTGKVFGKLTAVSPTTKDKHGQFKWKCICSCGGEKNAIAGNLIRGKTLTCGCSGKRCAKRPDGEAAFTELIGRYRSQAASRGHSFELSEDEFRELTQLLCHYCGVDRYNKISTSANTGVYYYNGVDRKDNTKGYTKENSVSCCSICNRAKNNLPYDVFVAWIDQIINFNKECS